MFLSYLCQFVMKKLFFGGNLMLQSVNKFEPEVIKLREKISNALKQAITTLKAYAAEYEKYLELYNLDINTLLK